MGRRKLALIMCEVTLLGLLASSCQFLRNDDLNQAALRGDRARCKVMLNKGANVNGEGMNAMKPIMSAAKGGNLETAKFLVTQGADVNAHNASGSALMWAVYSRNEELLRLLLTNGADPNWSSDLGDNALSFAAKTKQTNMVRILETWRSTGTTNNASDAAPRRL